jgi:hypothetical protein
MRCYATRNNSNECGTEFTSDRTLSKPIHDHVHEAVPLQPSDRKPGETVMLIQNNQPPWPLVRERTIPTERPPP